MDSGANKGTAFGTVQCLYVASYLFAATVARLCGIIIHAPRHRRDAVRVAASARWRGVSGCRRDVVPVRFEAWRFTKVHAIFLSNLTHLLASAQVDRDDWPAAGAIVCSS